MLFWCFVKSDAGSTGAGGAGGGFMVSSSRQDVRLWVQQVWFRFSIVFCKPQGSVRYGWNVWKKRLETEMLFWCFVKSDAGSTGAGGAGGGFMVSSSRQDVRLWVQQVWFRFSIVFCKPQGSVRYGWNVWKKRLETEMQRQICFQVASKINYLEVSRSMLIKKLLLASSRNGSWLAHGVKCRRFCKAWPALSPFAPRSDFPTSFSSLKQTSWNHGSS